MQAITPEASDRNYRVPPASVRMVVETFMNRLSRILSLIALLLLLLATCPSSVLAQRRAGAAVRPGGAAGPGAAGMVNLPYSAADSSGNQWIIYQGGWLQQRGN